MDGALSFVHKTPSIINVQQQRHNTFINARKWALAHNKSLDPDSIPTDLADYYDHDERETNRMLHSSGRNADTCRIIKKTSVSAKTRRTMATDTRKAKMTTKVKMQI